MRIAKVLVFLFALAPAASTGTLFVTDALGRTHALGANPIDALTDTTGIWALRFVLATLAVTPIRRISGWNGIIRFRRMLGLFACFYAALHFLTWLVIDQGLAWEFVLADIAKRPYVTAGFAGFVLMIPLAITSTAGWIRRLGGRWWNRLHRLVYATGVAGVVHFLWLVKVVEPEQIAYAAILTVLLGLRLWWALAKRLAAPVPASRPTRQPAA
jgi:methionine sulfoxide reductase heme-binding subunit